MERSPSWPAARMAVRVGKTLHLGCLVEVQQIAVLPSQPDVVYLSVLYYSAHTGTVLKSTDSGETWTTLVLPVGGADFQLLIDPENPQRLFASGLNGILRSLDGGETWQQISNQWMTGYFALAFSGGSLFAISKTGYETSVYRTDDGGEIWWSSVTPLPAGAYMLQPDPTLPGNLWAGLFGYGVYHTANGGGSWVEQNSGISTIASNSVSGGIAKQPKCYLRDIKSDPILVYTGPWMVAKAGDCR